MKYTHYLILVLLFASCGNNNKSSSSAVSLFNKTEIDTIEQVTAIVNPVTIHIDAEIKPLYDSISVDNIIDDIRLIPLETNEKSFIGGTPMIFKVNDYYVINDGRPITPKIKVFGNDGKYLDDAYLIGRGPDELPTAFECAIDYSSKELYLQGPGKVLVYSLMTGERRHFETADRHGFRSMVSLNNGSFMAVDNTVNIDNSTKKIWRPIFYFLDSEMRVTDSILSYKAIQRMIEGSAPFPILADQLYDCNGRVLCKEDLCDTVFLVNKNKTFTPVMIIDIPEKLSPTIKNSEMDNWEKKTKMIYIRNILESKDYVFITYRFRDLDNMGIWDKQTGDYLYGFSAFASSYIQVELNDRKCLLPFYCVEWESNTIVAIASPSQYPNLMPNMSRDDNPVVVEVKLKER